MRTLLRLPSWVEWGFAVANDFALSRWRGCDRCTIRRMRREAQKRGEIRHVWLKRGDLLPNGERVQRVGLWVLLDGPARAARAQRPSDAPAPEPLPTQQSLDLGPSAGLQCARTALIEWVQPAADPQTAHLGGSNCTPPLGKLHTLDLSDLPKGEIDPRFAQADQPERGPQPKLAETGEAADHRDAEAVARHYATATGKRWRTIHGEVLAFVMRFVREMVGSDRVARACRAIDSVVLESARNGHEPPTLRYVLHEQLWWRRLEEQNGTAPPARQSTPSAPSGSAPRAPETRPATLPATPTQKLATASRGPGLATTRYVGPDPAEVDWFRGLAAVAVQRATA